MVRQAPPDAPAPRPVEYTLTRKLSAVAAIILLYTAATPFSPIVWITTEVEGSFFLDRLIAGTILFGALYFQWRIAATTSNVVISLPTGGGTTIRDGNIARHNDGIAFLYEPTEYWKYLGAEALLLLYAQFGDNEIYRRLIVSGVLAPLWAVGWFVTPERIKREGWEHLKRIWFWIALDEIMRVGTRGSHAATRRRRW